ncbi:hypothetical protein OEZ86_012849 [Tetradesmus obliquus]|nr:hypothetical protein OEZ86_012849 [Tetradesmus obliquus]
MAAPPKLPPTVRYAEAEYWESRYQREPAVFEWFFGHTALRRIIRAYVTKKKPVLHLGCGTSNLQEGMAKSGYTVVNTDISTVVITKMKERHANYSNLSYVVSDCRDMPEFLDCQFGHVVDKGTIDALLCCKQGTENVMRMLLEAYRVLQPGGSFLLVTLGDPTRRLPLLLDPRLQWKVSLLLLPKISAACQAYVDGKPINDTVKPIDADGPYEVLDVETIVGLPAGVQYSNFFFAYVCKKQPLQLPQAQGQKAQVPNGWVAGSKELFQKLQKELGLPEDLLAKGRRKRVMVVPAGSAAASGMHGMQLQGSAGGSSSSATGGGGSGAAAGAPKQQPAAGAEAHQLLDVPVGRHGVQDSDALQQQQQQQQELPPHPDTPDHEQEHEALSPRYQLQEQQQQQQQHAAQQPGLARGPSRAEAAALAAAAAAAAAAATPGPMSPPSGLTLLPRAAASSGRTPRLRRFSTDPTALAMAAALSPQLALLRQAQSQHSERAADGLIMHDVAAAEAWGGSAAAALAAAASWGRTRPPRGRRLSGVSMISNLSTFSSASMSVNGEEDSETAEEFGSSLCTTGDSLIAEGAGEGRAEEEGEEGQQLECSAAGDSSSSADLAAAVSRLAVGPKAVGAGDGSSSRSSGGGGGSVRGGCAKQ